MPGEKTEQPTAKRIRDARKKGQAFKSQDITQALLFLTAAGILVAGSSLFSGRLQELLKDYFDPRRIASPLEPAELLALTGAAFERFLILIAPMTVALAIAAAAIVFLQVKPLFSPEVVQPKFDKLNPIQGFQNIFFKSKTYIELLKNLTRESLMRAIRNYEQAIALDPGYAAAHYGLAVARHGLPSYANDNSLFDRRAIEQEYQKAAELDPNYSDPHTGLALLAAQNDWDWERAERELATASAIGPSAMAEGHSALLALIRGRPAEVTGRIRRARDLDPLGVAILMNTSEIQIMAGEYQGARDVLQRFLEQHPGVDNARLWIAISFVLEGRAAEALPRLQALEGKHPDAEVWESAAQAMAGHREEALRLVQSYEKQAGHSEAAIAVTYAFLRDEGRTLEWLNRSVDHREPFAMYLTVNPAFRFLRDNPAFEKIIRRAGLSV